MAVANQLCRESLEDEWDLCDVRHFGEGLDDSRDEVRWHVHGQLVDHKHVTDVVIG